MTAAFDAVVFDLDGTLIDSAPGILQGFELAFSRCGVTPLQPWSPALIGPPLVQTIAMQCESRDPQLLETLRQAFMTCYDTEGYRMSTAYDGIHAVLQALRSDGLRLFIATNKRIVPTLRILEHLGWSGDFEGVFGVDSLAAAQTPKAQVIGHITQTFGLHAPRSLYVGDRYEDYEAASAAGLPFALATWGFSDANARVPSVCARLPDTQALHQLTRRAQTR